MTIRELEEFIALAKANGADQSTNVRCEIMGVSGEAWGCHYSPVFSICLDCAYYAEYGRLDDTTMALIEKEPPIPE